MTITIIIPTTAEALVICTATSAAKIKTASPFGTTEQIRASSILTAAPLIAAI